MYSNKLIACVKHNGKVLREKGENVFLPFGSEYTLWFKNEHSRKVQIDVSIDGTDVLFGRSLLLNPNETMDLKGFVRDMNGCDNRAFRFITKTQEISDFRGDKIEDGLIKITYQFEQEKEEISIKHIHHNHHHYDHYWHEPKYTKRWDENPWPPGTITCEYRHDDNIGNVSMTTTNCVDNSPFYSTDSIDISANCADISPQSFGTATAANTLRGVKSVGNINDSTTSVYSAHVADDPGITVEGSDTGQSFKNGYIGRLESKVHTMVFQLKGLVDANEEVSQPVTVKAKKQCPSCGKKFKGSYEYCPHDGTFLRFP